MYQNKGFTLIELLVVVLIIGILAAVALPQYQAAVEKSRVARVLPLLKNILTAQEVYYMANGETTTDLDLLDISMDYSSIEKTDDDRPKYIRSDGTVIVLGTSLGYVFAEFPKGYHIDFYGKSRTRGNVSGSGLCYPKENGGLAERICKTMGPKSSVNSARGTNVYVFSY